MIRHSPIAGSWYAGTNDALRDQLNKLFSDNKFGPALEHIGEIKSDPKKYVGIIAPHAGYVYSGYTAAHSYSALKKYAPDADCAIILGVNHRGLGKPVVFTSGEWELPMGNVIIDPEIIEFTKKYDFGNLKSMVEFNSGAHANEHSLEIQVPFLQFIYNDIKIFPIMTYLNYDNHDKLVKYLYDIITHFKDKKIVIVASSDFSHEYDYNRLINNDKTMIEYIKKMDIDGAENFRISSNMTMCGYSPVLILMRLFKKLSEFGALNIEHLAYTNSSTVRGNIGSGDYCVGYASFVLTIS